MRHHLFWPALWLIPLLGALAGCAGTPAKNPVDNPFEKKLANLINTVIATQHLKPGEMAPAGVMPCSPLSDKRFSRLEELVVERLTMALRKQNDLYRLSRQNWFEFREGRPLTFMEQPADERTFLRNLIVYEVAVSPDTVLHQIHIHIVGTDAEGRAVSGAAAEATFDAGPGSVAHKLYHARPNGSPYPEGLEERPYVSLDRLVFSVVAELADAYRNGMPAGREMAADEEVRVVLYANDRERAGQGLSESIQDALQQAIVSHGGFTCAVSREDFGPAFAQINFYQRNPSVFKVDASLFAAGTVLLMFDIIRSRYDDRVGVALRALWRASPLETSTGKLIPTRVAGTYLSGFTARAYLSGGLTRDDSPVTRIRRPSESVIHEWDPPLTIQPTGPARDLGVCFYDFTEVLEKRIYPVLARAPGVTEIRRADERCNAQGCICYAVGYKGSIEAISAWLREHLRLSCVLAFHLMPRGEGQLDLYFDGGFM